MKLKKIIVVILIILSVFFIYLSTLDKKVYYLSLGDYITTDINNNFVWNKKIVTFLKDKNKFETYVNNFSNEKLRTTDLYNMIINNEKVSINNKEKTIKNALIKADLVTLNIGMNDLIYKMGIDKDASLNELYSYVDDIMVDLDNLLSLIRKYCKEDILMTNYYVPINLKNSNNIKMIEYANKSLKVILKQYDIKYIDISSYNSSNLFVDNSPYLSNLGNDKLYSDYKEIIEKTLFNKVNNV